MRLQEQQAVETDTDQLEEPEPEPEAEAEEEAAMPPASDPSAQMTGAGAADAAGSEATATQACDVVLLYLGTDGHFKFRL